MIQVDGRAELETQFDEHCSADDIVNGYYMVVENYLTVPSDGVNG